MVHPPRDPGDDGAAEVQAERIGGGPWVIVPAEDPAARARAIELEKECIGRRVGVRVLTAAEVRGRGLQRFRGLVVVLRSGIPPTGTTAAVEELRDLGALIERFRAYNPLGLAELVSGRCEWFEVGTIQVVGPPGLLGHRALRRGSICVEHPVVSFDEPADLFSPYAGPAAPRGRGEQQALDGDAIERLLHTLRAWKVTDVQQVPRLRAEVEAQRGAYENPDLIALFRPVPLRDANRLDCVLDDVHHVPAEAHRKAYTESGARVVRETIKALRRVVPDLRDPATGQKGAQERFRLFYLALVIVDLHLRDGPGQD